VNASTHDVYVVDKGDNRVERFSSAGAFISQFDGSAAPTGAFSEPSAIAVDNSQSPLDPSAGDVYVVDTGHSVIDKFNAAGGYEGQLTETTGGAAFGLLRGVAVDVSGVVWVYQASGEIDSFSDALVNEYLSARGSPFETSPGFAVDSEDDLYVNRGSEHFAKLNSSGEVLNEAVDGERSTAAAVDMSSNEVFIDNVSTVAIFGSTGSLLERFGAEHLSGGSGIAVDPGSEAVYVADSVAGVVAVFKPEVLPKITTAPASGVGAASATLNTTIIPNGSDTICHFEWGTSSSYGQSVPCLPAADIGAGTSAVSVSAHLSGLSANVTYHWRVTATNASGTTTTGDHTFVYIIPGAGLPDNRAYEMVTPPRKNGAVIGKSLVRFAPDVSLDGSRVVIISIQCFGGAGSCTGQREAQGDPFAFSRTGGGWVTAPLAPPATQFGGNTPQLVNADTGTALFAAQTPPAGGDGWYARRPDGSFLGVGPVTPPSLGALAEGAYGAVGATADLSHIVWGISANDGGLWPFDATTAVGGDSSVYEYVGAGNVAPVLVGVSGGAGSTDLIGTCGTQTSLNQETPGSLSADGRVVFFTVAPCSSGSGVNAGVPVPAYELFARIDGSRSVLLSGRSPAGCTSVACLGSPASDAHFEGASVDGSKAFFTSTQQLTDTASEDSGDSARDLGCIQAAGVNGCNLYEYDSADPAGRGLLAVSAGDSSGGGPRVQGVVAVSSDGSHVYFVARGVLSGVANSGGGVARDGADNLYVFERDAAHPEGRVAFIASLPQSDHETWDYHPRPANVTPDGRFLVFTSYGALTADDTSMSGAAQVFRYDAQTGGLVRVSVGDRGFNDNGNRSAGTPCGTGICSEDASIAEPQAGHRAGAARSDPTMSHDGSFVFFRSPVALTPGALDDVRVGVEGGGGVGGILPGYAQNVYEYHDGRVFLISDGRDTGQTNVPPFDQRRPSDVFLLGSDATGANVFFATSDRLVGSDTDTELDVYDARVCTAGDPCVPSGPAAVTSCDGEACHGVAGVAPAAPVGATMTFSGPGNLAAPVAAHRKVAVKKHVRHRRRRGRPGKRRVKGRGAAHRGGRGSVGGRS
jgi:hypothetical protein